MNRTEPRKRELEKLKNPDDSPRNVNTSRRSSAESSSDNGTIALLKVEEFKLRAEELSQKLTEKFESQFQHMIDDLSYEMQSSTQKKKVNIHCNQYDENGLKKFVARDSFLTELFEITHIQSIYNIFVAVLFVFLLNTIIYDYFETGSIFLHISNLSWAFSKSTNMIGQWLYMQLYTLAIFPLFTAFISNQLSKKKAPLFIWSAGYLCYLLFFLYFPLNTVYVEDFPPVTTTILISEQVRFLMKVHAFVRGNTAKLQSYLESRKCAVKDEQPEEFAYPGFSQYLYFLFIPTLIYRDRYPMTPHIRWNFVVINLLQVIGCVAYTYFVFARFCVPVFQNTGKEKGNIRYELSLDRYADQRTQTLNSFRDIFTTALYGSCVVLCLLVLLLSAFSCMLPGMLVLLIAFFCILHSWMNAFAEMTRFADRMFYRDWWNAQSYSSYYRMWNVIVHDWLYAYIYQDFYRFCGHQGSAAITVFFISAIVHEYILAVAFRFFFPVLLIMFGGVGLVFFFVKPRKGSLNPLWNIYVWTSLCMGSGILMTLYTVEWYARQNCKENYDSWIDFLLPYSFNSDCVVWEWRS